MHNEHFLESDNRFGGRPPEFVDACVGVDCVDVRAVGVVFAGEGVGAVLVGVVKS